MAFFRTLDDCVSIDEEGVKEYIARNYNPEDIFPNYVLEIWAEDNGYKKVEDE